MRDSDSLYIQFKASVVEQGAETIITLPPYLRFIVLSLQLCLEKV